MSATPATMQDKVRQFNEAAAHKLYEGGEEAILSQMQIHGEIVAGMTQTIREKDEQIARLKSASTLIAAALKRPDVLAAFRDPKRVVVSLRTEDDPKGYSLEDSDLESVISDRYLASLFAWSVNVAMGEEVAMKSEENRG